MKIQNEMNSRDWRGVWKAFSGIITFWPDLVFFFVNFRK